MILFTSLIELKQVLVQLINQLENNRKHQALTNHVVHSQGIDASTLQTAVDLRACSTQEKEYFYRSNVITLYGAIEHFTESVVGEYIDRLHAMSPHSDQLDESVVSHYMERGIEMLGKAERSGKFKGLKKLDVMTSMYDTLCAKNSHLMKEFFISSGGGNYNHDEIMKCFIDLGAKDIRQKIKKEEPLVVYFKSLYGEDYLGNYEDGILFKYVDDLVLRRNDLAHGGNNIPMLGDNEFRDYIAFIEKYAEAMCSVLREELAKNQWRVSKRQELAPTNVYNNEIVCFQTIGETFKKGGYLLYQTGAADKYGYTKILSIQVEDVDCDFYKCVEITSIGCKVDAKINMNFRFKNLC